MYDALRETVAPSVDGEGPFEITSEREDEEFGIAYDNRFSSSRYLFRIEEVEEGTRLEATLRLGGLIGPFHSRLRFWSHNRHLDKLLRGIGGRAEEIADLDRLAESEAADAAAAAEAGAADGSEAEAGAPPSPLDASDAARTGGGALDA